MKVTIREHTVRVEREPGDPRFGRKSRRRGGWGDADSWFWGRLRKVLNAEGHNFIVKLMWRDGHMMDEHQRYARTRSPKSPGRHGMIWWGMHAVRDPHEDFDANGEIALNFTPLDPSKPGEWPNEKWLRKIGR
ncbi:MAG: hypothetical protein Q8Q29_08480 [Actinomycetota bacterium]|nr:hypothetical protein [Actinomycetota bacterium]